MKLFLSWSKHRSRQLALVLREWLPDVVHRVDPWMSSEDIAKGQAWMVELATQLGATSQGIICVTKENFSEPWLNFEAGALAKSTEVGRVRPVLLDLTQTDLIGPLAQFQTTMASEKEDMLKLARSLNAACDEPLDDRRLERSFFRAWPEFEGRLSEIIKTVPATRRARERSTEDKINEVLTRLRTMERITARRQQHGLHALETVPSVITVDVSALDSKMKSIQKVVDLSTTVDGLLDQIYFSLKRGTVPARTYGKTWALRHHDQSTLMRDLGSRWAANEGLESDERTLEEVGISLDAHLVAVPIRDSH